MARWRAPPASASPYITREGYQALQSDLRLLWNRRAGVVKHMAAAAAEGDRSENAEYLYRKKELREIDQRIGYLQRRLPILRIAGGLPADVRKVHFGAWVQVEEIPGTRALCRIVGVDEADASKRCISVDSPLARALLGKSAGEEVLVRIGAMQTRYVIVDIRYEPAAAE